MAAIDLCTVDAVKAMMDPPLTVTTEDALIGTIVTASSQYILTATSRSFTPATFTKRFNGTGADRLFLPENPVLTVSSLIIDGSSVPAAANAQSFGYLFDDFCLYLTSGTFSRGIQNVTVSWQAGYAAVPADVAQACVELAVYAYRERSRVGMTSKTVQQMVTAFDKRSIPARVADVIQMYNQVAPG
jgi:hypothetical protein